MWFPWETVGCFHTNHKSKVLWVSNESGCYYRGWLQLENSVVSRRCNVRWHLSGAHGWSHQDYLDLKEKKYIHCTASPLSNYYVFRTASEDDRDWNKVWTLPMMKNYTACRFFEIYACLWYVCLEFHEISNIGLYAFIYVFIRMCQILKISNIRL